MPVVGAIAPMLSEIVLAIQHPCFDAFGILHVVGIAAASPKENRLSTDFGSGPPTIKKSISSEPFLNEICRHL